MATPSRNVKQGPRVPLPFWFQTEPLHPICPPPRGDRFCRYKQENASESTPVVAVAESGQNMATREFGRTLLLEGRVRFRWL